MQKSDGQSQNSDEYKRVIAMLCIAVYREVHSEWEGEIFYSLYQTRIWPGTIQVSRSR